MIRFSDDYKLHFQLATVGQPSNDNRGKEERDKKKRRNICCCVSSRVFCILKCKNYCVCVYVDCNGRVKYCLDVDQPTLAQ